MKHFTFLFLAFLFSLSLNGQVVVQGTTTVQGGVVVSQGSGNTGPGLAITTIALPNAGVGIPYSATLTASGGTPPYTWALQAGSSLPAGLSLAPATGVISGTPTKVQTVNSVFCVTDSTNTTVCKQLPISVGSTLQITTASLPNGTVGVAYSATLAASGGIAPYTWALQAGSSLPAGLSLSTAGAITGTPTTVQTVNSIFCVTDSTSTTVCKQLPITINGGGANCGPPAYKCSRSDLTVAPNPAVPPQVGPNTCVAGSLLSCNNNIGANTIITDPDFSNSVVRISDSTWNSFDSIVSSPSGSNNVNIMNANSTYGTVGDSGATIYLFAFNPTTLQAQKCGTLKNPDGSKAGGGIAWSYTQPNIMYRAHDTEIDKYDFTNYSCGNPIPAPSGSCPSAQPGACVVTDVDNAQCLQQDPDWVRPPHIGDLWRGQLAVSTDEQIITEGLSDCTAVGVPNSDCFNGAGQGGGYYSMTYKQGSGGGCRFLNTMEGQVYGQWGPIGAINIADRWVEHEVVGALSNNTVAAGFAKCKPGVTCTSKSGSPYFWTLNSLNLVTPIGNLSGHWVEGFLDWFNDPGQLAYFAERPFTNMIGGGVNIIGTPVCGNAANPCQGVIDSHYGYNNADPNDHYAVFATSSSPDPINGITFPFALYNEIFAYFPATVGGTAAGTTKRFAHCFESGELSTSTVRFDGQECTGSVSPDGRFLEFSSDWLGTLGCENQAGTCSYSSTTARPRTDVFIVQLDPQGSVIVVTISPTSANLGLGQTQQFTATVTGTGNTAVTWSVSGTGCNGGPCGSVNSSGLYTAPSSLTGPITDFVTATSVADPTKSATATVVVTPGIVIAPTAVSVQISQTQTFTTNVAANFALSGTGCSGNGCGTLSAGSGTSTVYTAPSTVPKPPTVLLTATAQVGGTTATATITVTSNVTSVSVSPPSASVQVNTSQSFTATVNGDPNNSVTWSLSGAGCSGATCGTLNSSTANPVTYTAPSSVPNPATVTLTAASQVNPNITGTATITITTGGASGNVTVYPPAYPPGYPNGDDNLIQGNSVAQGGWSICYIGNCNGGSPGGSGIPSATTTAAEVTSPALDGSSLQLGFTGPANTNVLWVHKFPPNNAVNTFQRDFQLYVASPLPSQVEMDIFRFDNLINVNFMFGTQCDYAGGFWDIWRQDTQQWVPLNGTGGLPTLRCTSSTFAANAFHHVIQNDHIGAGNKLCFDSLIIDGTKTTINSCQNSGTLTAGFASVLGVQNQMDTGPGGTFNQYVESDNFTFSNAPASAGTVTLDTVAMESNTAEPFSAVVSGTPNQGVSWYVDNIAGGNSTVGTISATGIYTAPSAAGTHTVTGKSAVGGITAGNRTVYVTGSGLPSYSCAWKTNQGTGTAGDSSCTMQHDGITRTFTAHVPAAFTPGTSGMVIGLAGSDVLGSTYCLKSGQETNGWTRYTDNTLIAAPPMVVCPDALRGFRGIPNQYTPRWHSYNQRCSAYTSNPQSTPCPDDTDYIAQIILAAYKDLGINLKKIMVQGLWPNGAQMTLRMAVERGDLMASGAPIYGNWQNTYGDMSTTTDVVQGIYPVSQMFLGIIGTTFPLSQDLCGAHPPPGGDPMLYNADQMFTYWQTTNGFTSFDTPTAVCNGYNTTGYGLGNNLLSKKALGGVLGTEMQVWWLNHGINEIYCSETGTGTNQLCSPIVHFQNTTCSSTTPCNGNMGVAGKGYTGPMCTGAGGFCDSENPLILNWMEGHPKP